MRGNIKEKRTITLTGKIYLKYECEEAIFEKGDILVYLNDDSNPKNSIYGNYRSIGNSGYFKLEVFDGKNWRALKNEELFPDRENYFHKKEKPIDRYFLCKETLESTTKGLVVFYDYRDHYTIYEYVPNPFKGKKSNFIKNNA